MENLNDDLHAALSKQPKWVFDRAFQNASKFLNGTLVSKYDSKNIEVLSTSDVIDMSSLDFATRKMFQDLGEESLKKSEFAYFLMVGGIATSMGGCIKALVTAKSGKSFAEIKLDHVRAIQAKYHCKIPVIVMTNDETDKTIMDYLHSDGRLKEIDMIKIVQPVTVRFREKDGKLEVMRLKDGSPSYAPGGHYDAFILLDQIKSELRKRGIKTVFVNNIDNLGATIDPSILGAHIHNKSFFTPEVARKEKNEKGGVFARISGRMKLLEGPMVPEDYLPVFNDSEVHKYFNTNSIYVNTDILDDFEKIDLQVPAFINKKEIDGVKCFGFESAIGLVFGIEHSAIVAIDRTKRFCPVKFLSDLWLLRSNAFVYDSVNSTVYQEMLVKPVLNISSTFLGKVHDLDSKVGDGGENTDFLDLVSLDWKAKDGNVGKNVKFSGRVVIEEGSETIDDDSEITG